jgi:hypothetical protein
VTLEARLRPKEPRQNNFTLAAWPVWRRHSCRPRPEESGRSRVRVCATSVAEKLFLRGP